MKIDDTPPGLMSRRMFWIDMGRVVVEEHWDISVPGCPMIRSPWEVNGLDTTGDHYVRQVVMTWQEYADHRPPNFP